MTRRAATQLRQGYLAGACVLAAVYAFELGLDVRPPVLLLVVLSAIGITAVSYRRGSIDGPSAALFVGGFALFEIGDLTAYVTHLRGLPAARIPSLQDGFYFAGYPFFIAAITRLYARDRRTASAAILFSVTLALAAGFVLWAVGFSRFSGETMASTLLAGTYPVLDLVLVLGVAQALVVGVDRRVALPLLGGALAFLFADLGYAFVGLGGPYTGSFHLPGLYVVAYASLAAGISAMRPAAARSIRTAPLRLSRSRVGLMFLASVIAPFALIAGHTNHLRPNASAVWIAAIVALVFAQFAALLGERGAAETQLHTRERELRTLVDNAPALLWATDGSLRAVSVTGAALDELGWGSDAPGRLSLLIDSAELPEFAAAHRRALAGEPVDLEQSLDGRLFRCHVEPLTDGSGDRVGTIGVGLDVTEQARLEEQVMHAQRMEAVGQLAGTIAHDFNNLLTGISGYAELAAAKLEGHPAAADVAEIRRAAEHGTSLTSRLSIFSRKRLAEPSVIDANAVVAGQSAFLGRVIGEGVTVRYALHPEPARVRIDPRQFEQVILNLAINARDAMDGRGELSISTWTDDERFVLEVADQGSGMDEPTRARIFDAFYTTKEPGKGTGLGLASVLAIVTEAEGRVDVASEPGAGSTFTVSLPVDRSAASSAAGPAAGPVVGGSESILLVDDNELVRHVTAAMLESLGYRVVSAGTSEEALRLASLHPFRLLVTDVVLPDTDGRRLAGQIAALQPQIGVLFISGFDPEGALPLDSTRHVFLGKPFLLRELADGIRQVLAGAT